MRKLLLLLIMTTIIIIINIFTITSAKAETGNNEININHSNNQGVPLQENAAKNSEQIVVINQRIKDNYDSILKIENEMANIRTEITGMENELSLIEEKIDNRNEILKDRVRNIQHSGGNISYLEVLISSKDFGEFVDRVNSVTKIVQADQDLIDQQNAEIKEMENKQAALNQKLDQLATKKTEYEELMAYLHSQEGEQEPKIPINEKIEKENKVVASANSTEIEAFQAMGHGYMNTVITAGYKYIGNSVYVFGGGRTNEDIANGRFDCSGFVNWAFGQAGIEIGSTTDSIKFDGRPVPESDMKPGDLVFFDTYKKDGHVGIYIGNGKFIGSQSSTGVAIADMSGGYWKEKFNGRIIRVVE